MAEATADDIRIIRTLIPDTEAVFGEAGDQTMFSDDEITDFYTVGRGSALRAAGYANYAIATSEALISKKIQTQDLKTDGPAVADSLIKKADALFARADKDDEAGAVEFFQIVDFQAGWGLDRPELTEYGYGC